MKTVSSGRIDADSRGDGSAFTESSTTSSASNRPVFDEVRSFGDEFE